MNWNVFIGLNCLYTTLIYPFYTMNGFPHKSSANFSIILASEFFFFVDIVVSFFTQGVDDEGKSKSETLDVVATNYYYSTYFKMDLISFIPWGLFGTMFDRRLKFLWVVKALRIDNLNYYMQDKMIMPMIDYYIWSK